MELDDERAGVFEREGFLLLPGLLTGQEVDVLERELPEVTDTNRTSLVLDAGNETVRMVHGAHFRSPVFSRLVRHPRLVQPAERLLGGAVYVYKTRLNLKEGRRSRPSQGYPWHQDFSTWHLRDGLPQPRALVVFVFL